MIIHLYFPLNGTLTYDILIMHKHLCIVALPGSVANKNIPDSYYHCSK